MKIYSTVIERCTQTEFYIGFIPSFSGAHTQALTLDELQANLKKVIQMLLEEGKPIEA